jgi:SAM-dependent methyltransferase
MNIASYSRMSRLAAEHLAGRAPGEVIDVGSAAIGGGTGYRPIFEALGWRYQGCDLEPGANVDVVFEESYRFPFETASIDLVISGQAFEHIEFFWLTFAEIARVLRPGGLAFVIAPSRGHEHRYPVDCWRFYPDGMRALGKWGGLETLVAETEWKPKDWRQRNKLWLKFFGSDGSIIWGDTTGVFRKPVS